jgi:hypothetical protein
MTTRAKIRLKENWINIVLTFISIIQGLAFVNLVEYFPFSLVQMIFTGALTTGILLYFVHFLICVLILLRITQTYISAALDYMDWDARIEYIFCIFVWGALEYFLFSTLNFDNFDVKTFHSRLLIVNFQGLLSYMLVIIRLNKDYFKDEYKQEVKLQIINILGVFIPLIISILIIFIIPVHYESVYIVLCVLISVILVYNIWNSLHVTFSEKTQSTP